MEILPVTNKDLSLELLEIKLGITAIAEKQHDDSNRTTEIYDRVFKNGLVTEVEKTKIKIANIEGWKKNVNKVVITVISGVILTGISLLIYGTVSGVSLLKFFK